MKIDLFQKNISKYIIILFIFGFFPFFTHASVVQFVFVASPPSLAINDTSCKFTVQSQDANNQSVPVGSTFDITYASTSNTGTFSTNNTTWTPITSRTMASNSANINFYYKDSEPQTVTISVSATERANPTNNFSIQTSVVIGDTSSCEANTNNESEETDTGSTSSGGGGSITFFTKDEPDKKEEIKKPTVYTASLKREPTITAHTQTRFLPTILRDGINTIKVGRFVWTMGDGTQYEKKTSDILYHTYEYPGDYLLILDFYKTVFDEYPNATLRTKITVHEPSLVIEERTSDGTIILKNTSKFDIDTTGWFLMAGSDKYSLPNRTTILAGTTLKIPSSKTNIPIANTSPLALYTPNQTAVDTWTPNIATAPIKTGQTSASMAHMVTSSEITSEPEMISVGATDTISSYTENQSISNSLSAQANTSTTKSKTILYMIGFLGIIFLSIGGILGLLISHRKSAPELENSIDDIEIIE
jgi:hypothetical protein